MNEYLVSAFYCFTPISTSDLDEVQRRLLASGTELNISGLVLLATEGCNATIAGAAQSVREFEREVASALQKDDIIFKHSGSHDRCFRRFKVKVRDEIVTFGNPSFQPPADYNHTRLSPKQWHELLTQKSDDVVVIDTRNSYETELGKFQSAIDPNIKSFTELREFVQTNPIEKDKKVLMYCTGGIRCEKAVQWMKEEGFQYVFQLDGGILNYLKEFPNETFEGECFVFDHRVALDQHLQPSERYRFCPHCGDPGDIKIHCNRCDKITVICEDCSPNPAKNTCSKDCSYHYNRLQEQKQAA